MIVMEFVEGETLAEIISGGPLPAISQASGTLTARPSPVANRGLAYAVEAWPAAGADRRSPLSSISFDHGPEPPRFSRVRERGLSPHKRDGPGAALVKAAAPGRP